MGKLAGDKRYLLWADSSVAIMSGRPLSTSKSGEEEELHWEGAKALGWVWGLRPVQSCTSTWSWAARRLQAQEPGQSFASQSWLSSTAPILAQFSVITRARFRTSHVRQGSMYRHCAACGTLVLTFLVTVINWKQKNACKNGNCISL